MGSDVTEHPAGLPLVLFAVKEELAPFLRVPGVVGCAQVALTGMGITNAEHATRNAIARYNPTLIITSGFAGALKPGLRRGQVLLEADPAFPLAHKLRSAGAVDGSFLCVDRVASSAAEKRELAARNQADAVEMESCIVRKVSRQAGIPSATVRVILDELQEDLPLDFNTLMTPDYRLDGWKLAAVLARNPSKVPRLLTFQRQTRAAAASLSKVLAKALLATPGT